MCIKIAIVDDHPILVKGLRSMLNHNPDMEIIDTYMDGEALLKGFENEQPDILLMDIQMQGMSWLLFCIKNIRT